MLFKRLMTLLFVVASLSAVTAMASDDDATSFADHRPGVGHGPGHGGPVRPGPIVRPNPGHDHGMPGHHPGPAPRPRPRPGDHNGGYHHAPVPIYGGHHSWPHWNHPIYPRPIYNWRWANIRWVTCTAIDSWGDRFPVTESAYTGWGYYNRMQEIENAALSRCYYETQGDAGCRLLGCNAFY